MSASSSGARFPSASSPIHEYHRFDGVSDPDDLSVVYAIEARDGTRGVLVDAFGVYADPAVGEILRDVAFQAGARGNPPFGGQAVA